jgi:hypothetical protein
VIILLITTTTTAILQVIKALQNRTDGLKLNGKPNGKPPGE